MRKRVAGSLAVLTAAVVVAAPGAAADRKAPRIVAAAMQDVDGDFRADRLRLTYSERVRHAVDRDGKYPLIVSGYRIRSVGRASGKTIVLALVEKKAQDDAARPRIRYKRTKSKPVKDRSGNQAAGQTFRGTRGHGKRPQVTPQPAPQPTPQPTPQPPPSSPDRDGDGYPDAQDCAPDDPSINPGAPDSPELAFLDSNCDGIDGTEANAIFASPLGNDANPGTKAAPKRQIHAAVSAAVLAGKHVYAAGGTYERVVAATNVHIYGGYGDGWTRSFLFVTSITGVPEGILAQNATGVVLQYVSVRGNHQGSSAYGIRAINGSDLTLQRVTVTAGDGAVGAHGASGGNGAGGGPGGGGALGNCDGDPFNGSPPGGDAGGSPVGMVGGDGGHGGEEGANGGNGEPGAGGTPGGPRGAGGNPGGDGGNGQPGVPGATGQRGLGGTNTTVSASLIWFGQSGTSGGFGSSGNGGGGGGGGGGQGGTFVIDGDGNAGGGGGGGAAGGVRGVGGGSGGGSFGVYLYDSMLTADSSSSIAAGNGGQGGTGGNGGLGGTGGAGGPGGNACPAEAGTGGNGGRGGNGGNGGGGGGGTGGPSIGVMRVRASTASLDSTSVVAGSGGIGGAAGANGNPIGPAAGETGQVHTVYHQP